MGISEALRYVERMKDGYYLRRDDMITIIKLLKEELLDGREQTLEEKLSSPINGGLTPFGMVQVARQHYLYRLNKLLNKHPLDGWLKDEIRTEVFGEDK